MTRLTLLVALLVALPAPARARGRTIVWFRTASVERTDDLQTPTRWIQIEQDGSWKREDKVAKGRGTTITRQWGALEPQAAAGLFRAAERAAHAGAGGRVGSADPKQGHETLALVGFGRGERLLQRAGKQASPGFAALAALIERAALTIKDPAGKPAWRIELRSWTMVGEGARWGMSFDARGLYSSSGGGDIGCGYDEIIAERYVVAPELTRKVHAGVEALVKTRGLKPGPGLPPVDGPGMRMRGSSYTLHGFADRPITVRGAAAQDLAALLAPLRRPSPYPPALPFVIGRVAYSATLPGKGSLEGTLYLSGHHVQAPPQGKARVELLAPARIERVLGAIQQAVDSAPPQPASGSGPGPVGYAAIFSLHFKSNRLNLNTTAHEGMMRRVGAILARQLLGLKK